MTRAAHHELWAGADGGKGVKQIARLGRSFAKRREALARHFRPAPASCLFRDILVVPPQKSFMISRAVEGGPIWPDFETQTAIRFLRRGLPRDVLPAVPAGPPEPLNEPAVWGGHVDPHFGHLVSELLTRLPWSVRERPDDLYVFAAGPGIGAAGMSDVFWEILAWFGLSRAQVRFVDAPLRAAELRVWPQGEQANWGRPDISYLRALEAIAARNGLSPVASDLLYVSREGLAAEAMGAHAGEGYLVSLLRGLGVRAIDPGALPLCEQLAHYAGARDIVFAEGSAMHGRQLLARIGQRITVLVRRPAERLAEGALGARVRDLHYAEAARHLAVAIRADGAELTQRALSFYDPPALFAAFARHGIDLAPHWDEAAYRAARDADSAAWAAAIEAEPARYLMDETRARLAAAFAAENVMSEAER
jgi:hypothetical protein